MTTVEDERVVRLRQRLREAEQRARSIGGRLEKLVESRKSIVDTVNAENRDDLSDDEDALFRQHTNQINKLQSQYDEATDEAHQFADRIAELVAEQERNMTITEGASAVRRSQTRVTEPGTYTKESRSSYFRDLMRVHLQMDDNGDSRDRLQRHAQDVATGAEYRDLSRTDGAGGYLTPPAYLVADFADLARAARVTANLVNTQPLPSGTDNINIPLIATGTATAIQTADNAAVQETDLTDATVSAPVRTIAGQQDVAIQLLDQSPIAFDRLIFQDLMADYAAKVDVQVISGSNASGQVKGILGSTGITSVTYTDTSPSVSEFYSKLADAVQQIHSTRFLPPTVIVMHPRRWGWLEAASDTTGRPLIVPSGPGVNSVATANGPVSEGIVGNMLGIPVAVDPNIPTNLGAGTNEDRVLVLRANDLLLWESGVKTRVLPDVGSGTLTVRLQVYGYLAFSAEFRPKSTAVISSTGLITPAF